MQTIKMGIACYLVALSTITVGQAATTTPIELRVKPSLAGEFQKPLPEILVFSPTGECLFRDTGFSSAENLKRALDQALKGKRPSTGPAISKEALEEAITNAIMANEDIPAEAKQQVIESSLAHNLKSAGDTGCDLTLDKAAAMFESPDGSQWDRKTLQDDLYTLVAYSADWCSPCHAQKAAVGTYIEERQARFNWLYVERDAQKIE